MVINDHVVLKIKVYLKKHKIQLNSCCYIYTTHLNKITIHLYAYLSSVQPLIKPCVTVSRSKQLDE